jgi:hypothetical protein
MTNLDQSSTETSSFDSLVQTLPEDLQGDPSLGSIKSFEGLVSSYLNGQRMIGGSLRIPDQNASEEDRDKFWDKLKEVEGVTRLPSADDDESFLGLMDKMGRPSEAKDYEFAFPEEFTKETLSDENMTNFMQKAHEIGLTKKQAQGVLDLEIARIQQDQQAQKEYTERQTKQLQELWGNGAEERIKAAEEAKAVWSEKFPDLKDLFSNEIVSKNAGVIAILAEMGRRLEKGNKPLGTTSSYKPSTETIDEQIDQLYKDNTMNPYERNGKVIELNRQKLNLLKR